MLRMVEMAGTTVAIKATANPATIVFLKYVLRITLSLFAQRSSVSSVVKITLTAEDTEER